MSDDLGRLHAAVHGTAGDMQVSAAQAAVGHIEPDLAGPRPAHLTPPAREMPRSLIADGFHDSLPRELLPRLRTSRAA